MKNRNLLFDNIKALLIFLVVFGHTLELLKNKYVIANLIYAFIYTFHMPAFIFISGYFSKNLKKSQNSAFEKFLIPFLVITIPWNLFMFIFGLSDFYSFFTPAWAMWYLYSMFIWKLILPYILKIKNIFKISIILGAFAGIFLEFNNFMSISRTITFLPYFLAGYFYNEYKLENLRKKSKIPFIFLIVLVFCLCTFSSIVSVIPVEILWLDRPFISLQYPITFGILIRLILYLIGFGMIYALLNIITSEKCIFSKIGKNTLSVYILHTAPVGLFFGISYFIHNLYINLILAFLSSIIITYLLSRNCVNEKVNKFFKYITSKIIRTKK